MLNGYIVTSVIIAVSLLLLGGVVFYRNPKQLLNKLFLAFSISMAGWLVVNYLGSTSSVPYDTALIANRLVFVFGALSTILLFAFVRVMTGAKSNIWWKVLISLNIIAILISLTNLVVNNIVASEETYSIVFGVLSPLYFFTLFANSILLVTSLVRSHRKAKGIQKQQIDTILITLVIALAAILITNAIFPIALNYYGMTNIGSFFSVIIVIGVAYTIAKHKLFDLRLVVARAFAYGFSVLFIVILYSLLTFSIANIAFGVDLTTNQELVLALFSAVIALAFQPVKRFFDKFTNSIFYRDAYDGQEFLNSINAKIVTSSNLHHLLHNTAETIKDQVKLNFCNFYIDSSAAIDFHTAGNNTALFAQAEWSSLIEAIDGADKKIITSESSETDEETVGYMRSLGIELVLKMTSKEQDVGYMILSERRSGTNFSQQDIQILEIIADEVAIAVQNAVQFEQIAQFNVTLQKKIEDATGELQKSNEKLKALDEAKDEFISMASHQLRTPLTSVKGYISMVLEGDAGEVNENQKKFLDQAYVSSQRMVYLVADLLNVSRLKTGKFVVESKPTYMPDMVESEIAQLYETAKARDLQLVFEKPESFPMMNIDETKTRQVVMNFADNAIYYTPNGGRIVIKLKETKTAVEFTVTDSGIGVPKNEQHHLFTKFYRAGNAKKARPDGTGLGLFMAKKVIVAQGGAVIFKTQEGKGSTFGFSFPRKELEVKEPEKVEPEL